MNPKHNKNNMVDVSHSEFVLVFLENSITMDERKVHGLSDFQKDVACIKQCTPLDPTKEVCLPPNPSPGITNMEERTRLLNKYTQNPLVLEVHVDAVEGTCSCRHFLGFGFSRHMPYFTPGTQLLLPCSSPGRNVTIESMVTACGQRSREFGILISFSHPVWTDEVSAMFPGFNMTEIEDDEGVCKSLVELVWRYNCTMGDLEVQTMPCRRCILGSEALLRHMMSKFQNEMDRMQEAVGIMMVSDEVQRMPASALEAIKEDFHSYKSSLCMVMRFNPLGTREWLQHFEAFMTTAAARRGLGFLDYILY